MTSRNAISVRIRLAVLAVIICFSLMGVRLYYVQIARHGELYAKAKNQYTATATKQGKRGEIYDYYGNLLVGNVPCTDICADPQLIGDAEECRAIAEFFASKIPDVDVETVYQRLMHKTRSKTLEDGKQIELKNRYAVIANKVDYVLAKKLERQVEKKRFKGIEFRDASKRYYPKKHLLANILGFTNIESDKVIAVIGIEKFFNKAICPTKIKSMYERSRDGLPLSYGNKEIKDVRDGLNIFLTIREPLQAILEEEMDQLMEEWKPRAAYAIMADPYTGSILAVAQRPTFNPNDRTTMTPEAWRNRIAEDVFEPGSTMKPFAVAAAMDYGIVAADTKFDCEKGLWYYGGKALRDSHPMGMPTTTQIVQKSSNIGTAKIALMLGDKRLFYTLKKFGFGSRTGVPLKPETKGIFRDLENWDKLSITRFPIGQGIAVSPLQLLRAYCALANGGSLVKLRMVDRIENPETGLTVENPIKSSYKVFKHEDTHKKIKTMMKLVTMEGGTAKKAKVKGYNVAGKTGTSQKFVNGEYSHKQYFATFVGFVPADNPAFVLLVTADEPKGAHYGGTVAAPTFRRISEKTLKFMNIPPDAPEMEYAGN